jgi:hypothetical protein
LPACRTASTPSAQTALATPPELLQVTNLYEVTRYLYRWKLDESEIQSILGEKKFVFWVRPVAAKLDAGDHSQFGEILLPQLGMRVKVKKTDYTVEELGTPVKSANFKISHVFREPVPDKRPMDCTEVAVEMQEMRDYLFRTRNQHDFPDAELLQRMREALRAEVRKQGGTVTNLTAEQRVVFLAPLSPVANESWVFWEPGHKLFYFSSDIDLANPAVWQHEALMARVFDLDQQVVVSHDEAPGSNRFLTRYQVSRALFNCILLGQRVEVPPYVPPGPK